MEDLAAGQLVAIHEVFFQDIDEFQNELIKLKNMQKKTHRNLVKMIRYSAASAGKLCSRLNRIIMVLEYITRDLSGEIHFRKLLDAKYFTEEEMW